MIWGCNHQKILVILFKEYKEQFQTLPELYKDLAWTDPKTELVWIPNNIKEVSNRDRDENEKLLEKIENDDDVQNVFHNMKD